MRTIRTAMERAKPIYKIDIRKCSTEGLTMIWAFLPTYKDEPEDGLVAAAAEELRRRGVITPVEGGMIDWHLPEDVRLELREIWADDQMAETFQLITSPEAV